MPWGTSKSDGWLLVWMTRPVEVDPEQLARKAELYMRLKKHQLGLPRGVAFVYDEPSGDLLSVIYDGDRLPDDDAAVAEAMKHLRDAADVDTWASVRQHLHPSRETRKRRRNRPR